MKVVIAFDLENADGDAYERAYRMLEGVGLKPVTPAHGVMLPSTTVMGELSRAIPVEGLRDAIWDAFRKAGLRPTAIFGGVLDDWAARVG